MVTERKSYTDRLISLESCWKRIFDVQRPYRQHLNSLELGFVLDIGCGLGRNLVNLGGSNAGIGIDHNRHSVEIAKKRGLIVFTPEEFHQSPYAGKEVFDSILLSHVAEHMKREDVILLLGQYLTFLRHGGRLVMITPQERGYKSDPTHVAFTDFIEMALISDKVGIILDKQYSFPFPRFMGRFFKYNEFVTLCLKR